MNELLAFFDANQERLQAAAAAGHVARALRIAESLWLAFQRLKAPYRRQPLVPLEPIQAEIDHLCALPPKRPQKAKAQQIADHLARTRAGIEGALK